jgi:hypothetical protein
VTEGTKNVTKRGKIHPVRRWSCFLSFFPFCGFLLFTTEKEDKEERTGQRGLFLSMVNGEFSIPHSALGLWSLVPLLLLVLWFFRFFTTEQEISNLKFQI